MNKWTCQSGSLSVEVTTEVGFMTTVGRLAVNSVPADCFKIPTFGIYMIPPCLCSSVCHQGAKHQITVFITARPTKPRLRCQINVDDVVIGGDSEANPSNFEKRNISQMSMKEKAIAFLGFSMKFAVLYCCIVLCVKAVMSFVAFAISGSVPVSEFHASVHFIILIAPACVIWSRLDLLEKYKKEKLSSVIQIE